MYVGGRGGLPKDDRQAAGLYKLAADQGNASGQNNLGVFYEYGRGGLKKNDREAARLYKLAADQGYAAGQINLGGFYAEGRGGLAKDDREAARLYKLAADQGAAIVPLSPAEQVSQLSGALLAFNVLAAEEMLCCSVGPMRDVALDNPKFLNSFHHTFRSPDGSEKTIVFQTFEDLDRYVEEIRRRFETFKGEILRRGFTKLNSNFEANVSRGCAPEWLGTGHVTVESQDFLFELHQEKKRFLGATVKDAVVVISAGGFNSPLFGRVRSGRIDIKDAEGKCVMSLVPSK